MNTTAFLHVSAIICSILQGVSIIKDLYSVCFVVFGETAPQWAMASSFTRFLDHTQRRTAVGRTPLDV